MAFDTQPLEKAIASLEIALAEPDNQFVRDSVVKRFEFTYEISWKLMRRFLETEVGDAPDMWTRKELFRRAIKNHLIDSYDDWVQYHEARNLTAHTYNEVKAKEVLEIARKFLPSAKSLLERMNEELHRSP